MATNDCFDRIQFTRLVSTTFVGHVPGCAWRCERLEAVNPQSQIYSLRPLGPPWATLGHLGPPWATLGHLGPPWAISGPKSPCCGHPNPPQTGVTFQHLNRSAICGTFRAGTPVLSATGILNEHLPRDTIVSRLAFADMGNSDGTVGGETTRSADDAHAARSHAPTHANTVHDMPRRIIAI